MREAMRKVAIDYNRTPEAIAKQKQLHTSLVGMTVEDFAVDIPEIKDLSDYSEFLDGFDRGEKW
jgi:stage III sporulation protein SpoIIIAA